MPTIQSIKILFAIVLSALIITLYATPTATSYTLAKYKSELSINCLPPISEIGINSLLFGEMYPCFVNIVGSSGGMPNEPGIQDATIDQLSMMPVFATVRVAKGVGQIGREGEAFVKAATGLEKNTTSFFVNGRNRIPDFVDATALHEVKNVGRLSYTSQLRDFSTLAQDNGLMYNLWVRQGTKMSGPLRSAINDGTINLNYLPW